MNRILRELCRASIFIDSHGEHPLTTKVLSRLTGFSRKEVLKKIKTLKGKGLVKYVRTIEHCWDEPFFIQGWVATIKACDVPEFENALDIETAWFIHFFEEDAEADPWEYAKTFMSTRRFLDWRRTT